MLSDQLPRILAKNGGIGYMMKLFEESLSGDAPMKKDKLMADIISNLHNAGRDRIPTTKAMLEYAYKWKDIAMWQDLIRSYRKDLQVQGEDGLVRAWRIFNFDQTRARCLFPEIDVQFLLTPLMYSVEGLLRKKRFADRLAFINDIRQAASESDEKDVIQEWCLNQTVVALKSYVSADVSDVPLFVSMACDNGIQSIRRVYVAY